MAASPAGEGAGLESAAEGAARTLGIDGLRVFMVGGVAHLRSYTSQRSPQPAATDGTRIHLGVKTTLERLLFGPTSRTDGTENLVGAIRTAMGVCGAQTVQEFHDAELVVAPSIKTEGKKYQLAREQT